MNSVNSRASTLLGAVLVSALMVLAIPPASFATVTDPDYTKPLLDPATQKPASGPWLNVIPNALMAAFTYTPYAAGTEPTGVNGFPTGVCGVSEDCYTISVRRFQQDLGLKDEISGATMLTTVHGYGTSTNAPSTGPFVGSIWHAPAPTFKSTSNRPYRVTWLNQLPNIEPPGHDPTVEGGPNALNNFPYNRIVTHMHGAHVDPHSDGYPEAWYSPNFALTGTTWKPSLFGPEGTYRYINTQEAATTWYHDHASGLTHLNTQMGMAGFSLITDDNEKTLQGLPPGNAGTKVLPTDPYEVGFALQDRTFWPDGSIAMPDQPVRDLLSPSCTPDGLGGVIPTTCPIVPFSKAPDGHLIPYNAALADTAQRGPYAATNTTLEYFGNMPLVNGVVYGKYDVEPRVYRMRFIGGTDSRTWILHLKNRRTGAEIPFWQIGSEQGLLPNPVQRSYIDLMPGERIDVLVNFQDSPTGTNSLNDIIVLENYGPDMPYAGPDVFQPSPFVAGPPVLSAVIPEIMEFKIITLGATPDVPVPSGATVLRPAITPLTTTHPVVRKVSLIETVDNLGRTMPTIDTRGFMPMGIPSTENIKLNDVEQWDIINTTVDAHPMHLHLVAFQLIDRVQIASFTPPVNDSMNNIFTPPDYTTPVLTTTGQYPTQVMPNAWEAGWKDTIDCPPGWVTRVKAKFDIPGLYVWHCHILSHEEHDMMRPLYVFTNNILWRKSTGENKLWYMDGITQIGSDASIPTVTDANWKIVGRADFNADGQADILWRNTNTGENAVWFMNGVSMTSSVLLPTVIDQFWTIVGTGDFDADTKPDILWRNTSTGENAVWYMNGTTMTGATLLPPTADQNWTIVGTGDFNADNKPDILWRNTNTGENAVWFMSGVTMTGAELLPSATDQFWTIVGTGDFNGDTKPDILWRNINTGENAVWYMNGTTRTQTVLLPTVTDLTWKIVGVQ